MPEQAKSKLMARLRARRRREGWVRVEVWVPAAKVAALRAYVRKLTTTVTVSPMQPDQPAAVECPECFGRGKRNLSDGSWMRCDYCDGKGTTADKSKDAGK